MEKEVAGVWRTVRGRRIFIKEGEDLKTAMINSGKFKELRKNYFDKDEKLRNEKEEVRKSIYEKQREINKKHFTGRDLDEDVDAKTQIKDALIKRLNDIETERELNKEKMFRNQIANEEGLNITKEQFDNLKRNSNVNNLAEKTMKENAEKAKYYEGKTPEQTKEIIDEWKKRKESGKFDPNNYKAHKEFVEEQEKAWQKTYEENIKGYDARLKEMNDRDIVYKDEKKYNVDGVKVSEKDLRNEYNKEVRNGNVENTSYEDWKKSVVNDKNSNVRSIENEKPKYTSVMDRYNNDKEFRDRLKAEADKEKNRYKEEMKEFASKYEKMEANEKEEAFEYFKNEYAKDFDEVFSNLKQELKDAPKGVSNSINEQNIERDIKSLFIYKDEANMGSLDKEPLKRYYDKYGKENVDRVWKKMDEKYEVIKGTTMDSEGLGYNSIIEKSKYSAEARQFYQNKMKDIRDKYGYGDSRTYNTQANLAKEEFENYDKNIKQQTSNEQNIKAKVERFKERKGNSELTNSRSFKQEIPESVVKRLNQKGLKELANNGAVDITRYSDVAMKELEKKHGRLEVVKTTKGTYGMNGGLFRSNKTGEYFVVTSRNGNLFYLA